LTFLRWSDLDGRSLDIAGLLEVVRVALAEVLQGVDDHDGARGGNGAERGAREDLLHVEASLGSGLRVNLGQVGDDGNGGVVVHDISFR
jgi:hypothetical protein